MADIWTTIQVTVPTLALGTLSALYLKHKIGIWETQRAERRALINRWRKELVEDWTVQMQAVAQDFDFKHKDAYFSLRPHLSKAFIGALEEARASGRYASRYKTASGHYVESDFPRTELADEIGRIEKEWGL